MAHKRLTIEFKEGEETQDIDTFKDKCDKLGRTLRWMILALIRRFNKDLEE